MSYLQERFKNFDTDFFTFESVDQNNGKKVTRTLLSSDRNDNIEIHYHLLNGHPWTFHGPGRKTAQKYIRTRLKSPYEDIKYLSPKDAGLLPFFPPGIIAKFINKDSIETLVLIEGEIKAVIAEQFGLNCIGLGSIHGFYAPQDQNRKYYKEFAEEIIQLIDRCRVKNIVYLTDADTLSLNYKVDVDLRKRPNSFFKAVLNFRNITKRLVYDPASSVSNYYFAHIREIYNSNGKGKGKGIDDLIENNLENAENICKELKGLHQEGKWFVIHDLKLKQETHLKRYFGLENAKNFHKVYEKTLGDREFIFKKSKYYFDGENLVTVKNLALDQFIRVGAYYYKSINQVRLVDDLVIKTKLLTSWPKGEITTDHGPNATFLVKKYDSFMNLPNWLDHKQILYNNYNLCYPIQFKPVHGEFPNFVEFIQHIANDNTFIKTDKNGITELPTKGNTGTMLLDYLSIMIQHPTHLLPIPCLLSRKRQTGKTTFAQFISKMFEGNSTIIQTKDFYTDFNGFWASKFFVCVDEGRIDDKRAAKEKLKFVSTADRIIVNEKGINQKPIDSFCKVMICSNDEDDFIPIDKADEHFWIIKIKSIEKTDPDLKFKMFREIPKVFHYLMTREIFHKRDNRAWFELECIQNESFKNMIRSSKAHWKQEIDNAVEHVLDNVPDEDFYAAPMDILQWLKSFNKNTKVTPAQIINYLKQDNAMIPQKNRRYNTYIIQDKTFDVQPVFGKNGRPYIFLRQTWHSDPGNIPDVKRKIIK